MVKSNEMASEALKKSNDLYKANEAMMEESQKEEVKYDGKIPLGMVTGVIKGYKEERGS